MVRLRTPLDKEDVMKLHVGDMVYLDGIIFTARDRAHERLLSLNKKDIPFNLEGAAIFHCGPLMKKDGGWRPIAVGPTTSARVAEMTSKLLMRFGVKAIIGKGGMDGVADAMHERCVYLAATGGCAALTTSQVKRVVDVHWLDLGMPEAVWSLEVENFGPLVVGIDSHGSDLFATVRKKADESIKELLLSGQL